jgi:dTDP-4-amino-4,6-dideoxygalactose transaminase
MSSIPLVDLKAQYESIKTELDSAIQRVVDSAEFILGNEVAAFEQEFAAFCQATHAVGISSGTEALHLALHACNVRSGDEVITTPFTFIATAEAISMCGAKPVFVDIDPHTFNIDPDRIEHALTPRTKAIVPVHLYGQVAPMSAICNIAQRHGLLVIEDAAQAHGATLNGKAVGQFGHAAAFSFYPGKNLGAYGDAGAVVTNDRALADRVRMFRDHGRTGKYEHHLVGFGARLDALQAAILRSKLNHLTEWNEARRRRATYYHQGLKGHPRVVTPFLSASAEHVYHLFVIRVPDRDRVLAGLKARGIGAGVHYPIPLHIQPAYASLGYHLGDLPVSEQAAREVLSLPLYPEMTDEQADRVLASLIELVN